MKDKTLTHGFLKSFNERSASLLLMLLLCTDLAFFVISVYKSLAHADNALLFIGEDAGYAEIYQYIKWFWIVCLLVYFSINKRSFSFITWGMLFIYFLIDDAFQMHETFGNKIARNLTMMPPFGLRLQDIGELIVSGVSGIILLSLVILGYIYGSKTFRRISIDFILMICILIFFGVIIDMLDNAFDLGEKVYYIFSYIEDGGEMVVASLISWYAFLLCIRKKKNTVYLYQRIPIIAKWIPKIIYL